MLDSWRRVILKLHSHEEGAAAFQLICDAISAIDLETAKDFVIDLEDTEFIDQEGENPALVTIQENML